MGEAVTTPLEILRRARERISDPNRWCQGSLGRFGTDSHCCPCTANDSRAQSWCAIGAILRETRQDSYCIYADTISAIRFLREASGVKDNFSDTVSNDSIFMINDNALQPKEVVHNNVLDMYDKAISLAEAEEIGK